MKSIFNNHGHHIDEANVGAFDKPAIVEYRGVFALHKNAYLFRLCYSMDPFKNVDVWLDKGHWKNHEGKAFFDDRHPTPGRIMVPQMTLLKYRQLENNDVFLTGQLCPYCGNPGEHRPAETVYGDRYAGLPPMIVCTGNCDAYTSCHLGTLLSKGQMANRELRELRKKIHGLIDPIWKRDRRRESSVRRKALYQAFKEMMNVDEFHVAHLTNDTAVDFLRKFYSEPWGLRFHKLLTN